MRKLEAAKVKSYGAFLSVTLSKKSKPGDGKFGRGRKG
ncbi:lariocidin family lasso peptide [Bacillus subtilis]|uniref:Lariocidin family lasso peptide n=1 Tax=Bacillus subtilis TaxID=1423 RepID=A0AC62A0R9_BACIU